MSQLSIYERLALGIQKRRSADSRLKLWMKRFSGVATKYLPN